MKMKKAILLLADGFEEVEALGTVDFLRRSGVAVDIVSIKNEKVVGSHDITVLADKLLEGYDASSAHAVILPGGGKGTESLSEDDRVLKIVKDFFHAGKLVAAICAAPIVLDKAGILVGKNFTIYPTMKGAVKSGHYLEKRDVEDGNIITGAAAGSVFAFSYTIVTALVGEEAADKTFADMRIA